MSIITEIAANHLTDRHWLVFEPGDKQLERIGLHLATEGYSVFQPDRLDMMAELLRKRGFVVHGSEALAEQAAIKALRNRGWALFPPHKVPVTGTFWRATRPSSRSKTDRLAADRLVLPAAEPGVVTYRNMADGTDHSVYAATWWRWVTEVRGRVV